MNHKPEAVEANTICEWVQDIATDEDLDLTDTDCITLGNLLHDRLFPRSQGGDRKVEDNA